jgi:hypothetical protein
MLFDDVVACVPVTTVLRFELNLELVSRRWSEIVTDQSGQFPGHPVLQARGNFLGLAPLCEKDDTHIRNWSLLACSNIISL